MTDGAHERSVEFRFTRDVFAPNEVLSLAAHRSQVRAEVGALSWSFDLAPRPAHARALQLALATVAARLPGQRWWLWLGDSVAQRDDRISRHLRLWKSFERVGLPLPRGERTREHCVEVEDGLLWFGAVRFEVTEVELVAAWLESGFNALAVALPEGDTSSLETLIERGWASSHYPPPLRLLDELLARDGLLFWPLGAFDDREPGGLLLCPARHVDTLALPGLRGPAC